MAIPTRLARELDELRLAYELDVTSDSAFVDIVIRGFVLGEGFKPAASDLLIKVPLSYPDAGPDMFWTEETVTLANGNIPQNAELIEQHIGKSWRRFSWHHSPWSSVSDNMTGYVEFVRARLRQQK